MNANVARFAWVFAIALPCLAAGAGPYPKGALRFVSVPSVDGITVRAGIRASWDNYQDEKPHPVKCTIPADLFAYGPGQTPEVKNLFDHVLFVPPVPVSPKWHSFEPVEENVDLLIEVKDRNRTLHSIGIAPLGADPSDRKWFDRRGSACSAAIQIPWDKPYHRVDCVSGSGDLLFSLVVGTGRPDTYCGFKVVRYYSPALPKEIGASSGRTGDPYVLQPETLVRDPAAAVRSARLTVSDSNDRGWDYPVKLSDLNLWLRRPVGVVAVFPTWTNDAMDCISVGRDYEDETAANTGLLFKQIDLPPHVSATAVWSFNVLGKRIAYFQVPYTIAKQPGLFAKVKEVFDAEDRFDSVDRLGPVLMARFKAWLAGEGKGSHIDAAAIHYYGDASNVTCTDCRGELVDVKPIIAK